MSTIEKPGTSPPAHPTPSVAGQRSVAATRWDALRRNTFRYSGTR